MPRNSRKHNAGFTLLEMITVVVIAGIMFTIGLPMMKGVFTGSKLQIAAQHLSNTLAKPICHQLLPP